MGARKRYFLVSVALIVISFVGLGWFLESRLRTHHFDELEQIAKQQLIITSQILDENPEAIKNIPVPATVFNQAGVPVASNTPSPSKLKITPQAGKLLTIRSSGELYAITPYRDGWLQIRSTTQSIDSEITRLRYLLAGMTLAGILIAFGFSVFAEKLFQRSVEEMVSSVQELTAGQTRELELVTGEFGAVASPINKLAKDLRNTVKKLTRERGRLQAVLETMNDAIISVSKQGTVEFANNTARSWFGLDEHVIKKPLVEFTTHADLLALAEAGTAEESKDREFALGELLLHGTVRPKPIGGYLIVASDVTSIRHLERIRRDFVANVSHELRTPTSVILANAETLANGAIDDSTMAPLLVDATLRNAERLSSLVTDLLDLAKIESGIQDAAKEIVSVDEVAQRTVDLLSPKAADKEIQIHNEIVPPIEFFGVRGVIEQVLYNYVDNAIKYTPAGGNVWLEATLDDENLMIRVADDGPGIPEKYQERVFERFYRVDKGRSKELGGTGLGLSIVRNLAESMGGTTGVNSRSPQGSDFWVKLPRTG